MAKGREILPWLAIQLAPISQRAGGNFLDADRLARESAVDKARPVPRSAPSPRMPRNALGIGSSRSEAS